MAPATLSRYYATSPTAHLQRSGRCSASPIAPAAPIPAGGRPPALLAAGSRRHARPGAASLLVRHFRENDTEVDLVTDIKVGDWQEECRPYRPCLARPGNQVSLLQELLYHSFTVATEADSPHALAHALMHALIIRASAVRDIFGMVMLTMQLAGRHVTSCNLTHYYLLACNLTRCGLCMCFACILRKA
jgi:hypothetical protein